MADKVLEAELVEEDEVDPTDLTEVFFRRVKLTPDQEGKVAEDLDKLVREALTTRGDLDYLLAHWNDMAEGIANPKNFPWEDSSNLFIPVTGIHLNNVHAQGRQTLLKGDQMYFVRSIGITSDFDQAAKLERYLNYKAAVELPLVDRFSQLMSCTLRDGTGIAQVQWADEKDTVRKIVTYKSTEEFIGKHPTPDDAGLSASQFAKVLEKLKAGPVRLVEKTVETVYKGPVVTVVELCDFVMAPMTSKMTKYAKLVGKIFTMRGPEIKKMEETNEHSGWRNVDDVIASKEDGRKDLATQLKDDIEGISRRSGNGEFVIVDGIHRFDLNGDGKEEKFLFVYHPKTKKILDYVYYPYLNDKDCFIPVRIKKRPNRFLGFGFCQMLDDVQSEINTQHNQRVDSRTITTVPTFKAKNTAKNKFDPTRKDQRFIPGRVFWLDGMDDVQQFDIRPTDMGESMQEESTLMQLADQLTGSSQLRSGKETKADPRAPAAKVNMLLQQSNIRLDDYFEEMAGCAADNEGLNAIGEFILDLYYQFFDEDLAEIPVLKPNLQPETDAQGQPQKIKLEQNDFDVRRKFKIQMAKTSSSQNPEALLMKFMQLFGLLINEPLVGGQPQTRMALIRRLLSLAREENPDQFLPKDANQAQQLMQQDKMEQAMGVGGKGGAPNARTRNGQKTASVPAAGGSTRPLG